MTCRLPGGLALASGDRLREVELRGLSGREEEWLAWHPNVPAALAVSAVLGSCLAGLDDGPADRELARRLLVGDRDFLMLQLRRMTLGNRVSAVMSCPACQAAMDVDFDVDAVPVEPRPQETVAYSVTLPSDGGRARAVRFRLPNGADQEAVLALPLDEAVEALLTRCLIDDGDADLSEADKAAIIDVMERLAPEVDLELELICPECAHEFVVPFDTTNFFLQEMRVQRDQLMREVHLLALYYHWTEDEILRLTRERRRLHLALLHDTLQTG